jgi:membrane-associated protease RseP (regulator of RpoE activity)
MIVERRMRVLGDAAMNGWQGRMPHMAGLLLILTAALQAAPPSNHQIQAWVLQLDSEDYAAREAATRELAAAGDTTIDALSAALAGANPEIAWRASAALEQIAVAGNETSLDRVAAALERISQQGKPALSKVATELRQKKAEFLHDRAAAKIRSLGGKLSSRDDDSSLLAGGFFVGGLPPFFGAIDGAFVGEVKVEDEVAKALELPNAPVDAAAEQAPIAGPEHAVDALQPPTSPADVEHAQPPPVEPPPAEQLAPPPLAIGLDFAIAGAFINDLDIGLPSIGDPADGQAEALVLDHDWKGGDADLAALADLPELASLSIDGAKLTDHSLTHIAALPKLRELNLRGGQFTSAGLAKFRASHPTTRVYAVGPALLGVNAEREGPCLLSHVFHGSGAAEAGLQPGDEIVAVGGQKVSDFSDLTIAVFSRQPGEKVRVEIKRTDESKAFDVTLKDRQAVEPVMP